MRKFKIPKPESTTNKTIRFPNSVIDAFVIEATRVALENLLEEETSKEE